MPAAARPEELPDEPGEVFRQILDPTQRGRNLVPLYHRLRSLAPVYHAEHARLGNPWVITRHADLAGLVRNPALVKDERILALSGIRRGGPLHAVLSRMFAFHPPPRHTRLRALVNRGFTPRSVEELRPRIQHLADSLLDAKRGDGRMDLVADYAFRLSVGVICELVGAPVADVPRVEGWAAAISARADEGAAPTPDSERIADEAAVGFMGYLRGLIDERRAAPQDDLISRLLAVQREADDLEDEDIAATAILLFQAGHETTANMIGKGALALLQHPAELAKLRAHPALVANAAEELLRFDTPVQLTTKFADRDIAFGGHTLRAGDPVMLVWGAVNRDPERYADPDRLDLERSHIDHHSFGMGAHYCLGAALARLEIQQAVATLARRLPGLRLASDELVYKPQLHLHGLATLPVAW